jgi:hypothetical protein
MDGETSNELDAILDPEGRTLITEPEELKDTVREYFAKQVGQRGPLPGEKPAYQVKEEKRLGYLEGGYEFHRDFTQEDIPPRSQIISPPAKTKPASLCSNSW